MLTRKGAGIQKGRIFKQIGVGALLLVLLSISGVLVALPVIARSYPQTSGGRDLYVPLITEGGGGGSAAVPATGTHVYGLVGTLERPTGQLYSYYFRTANNGYYKLAGETPEIEQKIEALGRGNGSASVKIWGDIAPPESAGEPPLIVVTGILSNVTPVPTPVSTAVPSPLAGASVPVAVVKFDIINLYSGPASTFSVVGQVVQRQACEVTGRNQASSWLQLTCPNGQQGWVDARLVEVDGAVAGVVVINVVVATATPTVVPATPTPTATPVASADWRAAIYNNPSLSGTPVAVVDVPNLNFDWGAGGPSQVAADGFSIRFTRRVTVTPANYRFTAVADDGIRVWVDGQLIINAWPADPSQSYVAGQVMTGSHDLQVDYYEQSGLARVRLDFAPAPAAGSWQASYYRGVTPSGNPAFTQEEPRGQNPLDYNWSTGSPNSVAQGSNVLGNDYWSARWQGEFSFAGGNFVFRANVDDGIRLYIDDLLVLNQWNDGYKEVTNRVIGVGPGPHTIRVEYYERTGNASIQVWWYRDSAYTGPQ
jgi:uncharacterized protein YraI